MVSFARYVLRYSESNMYLLVENHDALLIDPNRSDEALAILEENQIRQLHILLTHEHFDHITGVNWYKEKFDATVICQRKCADSIGVVKNNRPFVFFPMVENKTEEEKREILAFYDALPVEAIVADVVFDDCYAFDWQEHRIVMTACPGHSMGSTVILFDNTHAFTGDYMIPDTPVILSFPRGFKDLYHAETLPVLLGLEGEVMIMPGHGEPCLRRDLLYQHGCFVRSF